MYVDVRAGRRRRRSWTEVLLILLSSTVFICLAVQGHSWPSITINAKWRKRSVKAGFWSEFNVGRPLNVCLLLFIHNLWDILTWEGLSAIPTGVQHWNSSFLNPDVLTQKLFYLSLCEKIILIPCCLEAIVCSQCDFQKFPCLVFAAGLAKFYFCSSSSQ